MSSVPRSNLAKHAEHVLGYLNFSAGNEEPKVFIALDALFAAAAEHPSPWQEVFRQLLDSLQDLQRDNPAFVDIRQAESVVRRTRDDVLPGYREFHRDLLFHLDEARMFNSFFVGRVFQVVLQLSPEREELTEAAIRALNDFIGHRPIPVLESQQIEPYAHELVRPIPVYIRDAGVCEGPHRRIMERALALLADTDPDILREACFHPEKLDEVAVDPRAYDFDHPVNKRPNYHFGQWDPHRIDNQGYFRRFVIQQVTLDSLHARTIIESEIDPEELIEEAAAVLAGTILMASGVSGWGPGAHSAEETLGTLLPRIARYRDEFYRRLIRRQPEAHRARLECEAAERRQPFGAARQSLNAELGNRRARQLQHVVLARVFAAMGHPEAAQRQVQQVPVASARMTCSIECLLTAGDRAARAGRIQDAIAALSEVRDLLLRAIECGALADPWSILGFDMNYSLFPALENSVHDHRVDELVDLVERIFQLHARVWSEAAAHDDQRRCDTVEQLFQSLALWWRQFAVHEVSSIDCGDSRQGYLAAKHVADGLNLWHKGGAASGDIGFWAPHVAMFDSPKAYTLLIERLLERDDHVAAMALLVNWLSRNEELPLEQGDASYQRCALQWVRAVRRHSEQPWKLTAKFVNYVEANAESYGEAPTFELAGGRRPAKSESADELGYEPETSEDVAQEWRISAYEDIQYEDSASDGVDGELAGERDTHNEDALTRECQRVAGRLEFLSTLSTLWTLASLPLNHSEGHDDCVSELRGWVLHANRVQSQLRELMGQVASYPIPAPLGDQESRMEYDRRRLLKESLLEQVIGVQVDVANAARIMTAALIAHTHPACPTQFDELCATHEHRVAAHVIADILRLDATAAAERFEEFLGLLEGQALLYIPLSRGGRCDQIVSARVRQNCLRDLLKMLPRAGMLPQVGQLLEAAREMERCQAATVGAVTEFDDLFNTGYGALVECLARSAREWDDQDSLVSCLEQLTEAVLVSWLTHSRTLRLSVLERVGAESEWSRLVTFIQNFGEDLFTQQFLNLGNVRAILHSGVEHWLTQMRDQPEHLQPKLIRELDQLDDDQVVEHLTVVLEAIIENYAEYRDYNSTTTLSDDGSMLYSLLDFLRLRSRYDRICWHLRPVVLAHQILVRNELNEAAELWRRALNERIEQEADRYLTQLRKLQKLYAMRLSTVADRLGERFIKPLMVDRLIAMVAPAMREAGMEDPPRFSMLEQELEELAREPTGAGLDLPPWLASLDEEVQRVRVPEYDQELATDELGLPILRLTYEQISDQLSQWD